MAKNRKTFFDGLIYVLNTLAAFALMASYLSGYISPKYISWFSILALAYPYLLLANIIFAIWWALRVKIKIVLPIVAIALGYQQIPRVYKSHGSNQVVASGKALKVMTYNVHSLNRYQWLEEDSVAQKISALIAEENPDVLLLQEYYSKSEGWQVDYPHHYTLIGSTNSSTGTIIYSKLPLLDKGYYKLPGPEGAINNGKAIWVDVNWNDKPIRIFNLHLSSVGLEPADYENLSPLDQENQEELQEGLYKIGGSLSAAFKKRAYQVEYLDSLFLQMELPIIVGGDFNDPPHSYTYSTLIEQLQDSYLAAGEGYVKTFDRKPLSLRIDYLMFDDSQLHCHDYKVIEEPYSDHYPVISEFSLR